MSTIPDTEAHNDPLQREIAARRRAEEALREAYAELESRVEERAAELARANASLRAEIAERERAEEALRQRLEELAVLHTVATVATEATGEDELIERATQVIGDVLYPGHFGVLLLDPAAGVLRVHPSYRIHEGRGEVRQMVIPVGHGIVGQVAATGQARRVPDMTREDGSLEADRQTRSELCVPLKVGERVIGVINAESTRPDAFSEADERLLTTCAEQLVTAIEKTRLFQAEARRRQEAETLRRVAAVISATTDRSAVLGLILDQLSLIVAYDSASVMLVSGETLDIVAQRGFRSESQLRTSIPLQSLPHVWDVLEQRHPVIIPDTASDSRWRLWPETDYICCWLGVPLMMQDRVIGLLNLDKVQPGFYTDHDAELAVAFASHATTAIENARLLDETRHRAQELEALTTISSALRQAQTREAMLRLVIEKSIQVLAGDAGALFLFHGEALVLAAGHGPSKALLGREHPPGTGSQWVVVETGEPLFIPDESGQSGMCQCGICRALMQQMTAAAFIPLKTAEATVGLLHLAYQSRREFSEEDRRLLATIAEIAGNALHRASFMETLEKRVSDRTRELEALYDVTTLASESLALQTTLERSLARVLVAMRSSVGTVHLLDETEETLRLAAHQGIPAAAVAQTDFSMIPAQLTDWVIQHGEPLLVPDLSADPQALGAARMTGPRAYMGVPMHAGGRVLGVLGIVGETGRQFNVEDVALLASIADQVAVAVENARLRQRAEQTAVMEERARLARELHDSVTQSVYSVTLLADATRDFTEAGEWERVKHYVGRISETSRQALKEMRLLLYELHPPVIEKEGLVEALSRRLDAVEDQAGVEVRLLAQEWIDLPTPIEEGLYRVAQEALNNALKHAEATVVTVHLRGNAGGVDLEVVDNGRGFDPGTVRSGRGMGLLNMRQRVEKLGGTLTILSAPGEGTMVKVRVGV